MTLLSLLQAKTLLRIAAAIAAAAIGADYIPGASHWIEGHPGWMASDGLHPNDAGYAAMATRMDAELTKLGL